MKRHLFIAVCIACKVFSAASQDGVIQISLSEYLQRVNAQSLPARRALSEKMLSEQQERMIRAERLWPSLKADLFGQYSPLLPVQVFSGDVVGLPPSQYRPAQIGAPLQLGAQLTLEYPLFEPQASQAGKIKAQGEALRETAYAHAVDELVFQAAELFFVNLQLRQALAALSANAERLSALEAVSRRLTENGQISGAELKRVQIAQLALDNKRLEVAGALEASDDALKTLADIPLDQEFAFYAATSSQGSDSSYWLSLQPGFERVTQNRLIQARISMSDIKRRQLRAQLLPEVRLWGGAGFQYFSDPRNDFSREFGYAQFGVRAAIPILDWPLWRRRDAYAHLEAENLQLEAAYLSEKNELEFRKAQNNVRVSLRMLRNSHMQLELSRDIHQRLYSQYREGLIPLGDVLQAQTAMVEAESGLLTQFFFYKINVVRLLKAAGRPDLLPQLDR